MANNIDIKFSGQVELRAAKYLYTGVDGDDCFRALNTNFYNSAYVYSSEISASSISNPENAFDRDLSGTYASTGTNSSVRKFITSNYRFRPHTLILEATGSGSSSPYPLNVSLEGFEEGNEFTIAITNGDTLPGASSPVTRFTFDNLHKKYTQLRRGWCDSVSLSSNFGVRVYQLFVYGEIIHETQDKLPPTFGATTIEAFTDSFLSVDTLAEGSIVKDGSLQLSPRRAHTMFRQTMTGTFSIPNDSTANVYNFDPNGSNRIVNLPRAPQFNHYIRINNLDGSFQIRVNDSDHSTLIQNLSNADGPNTLEAVWANNQWIVTT